MADRKVPAAWRIAETIAAVLGVAAILGFVSMRDDVRDSRAWSLAAKLWHDDTDDRLDHLERPELLIQLTQATDAVDDLEETARIARANEWAIKLVQQEQRHQRSSIAQVDSYLRQLLEHAELTPRPITPPPREPSN